MIKTLKKIFILLIAFCFASCELLSPPVDSMTEVSGRIINESTGEAVANLSVSLDSFYDLPVKTTTDINGNFYLHYDKSNGNSLSLYINRDPYSSIYSGKLINIPSGANIKKDFYVYQTTGLGVELKWEIEPQPNTYSLWIPGMGVNGTSALTYRAKGNFYNQVSVNYTIGDKHYEVIDSVYCPINTITSFTIKI